MARKSKQANPRDEPKIKKRTLVDVPRKKKVWTPQEEAYLQDKWGTSSIPAIAKNLGRSVDAVRVRACRLGCGAHLDGDARVSANQLMNALFGAKNPRNGAVRYSLQRYIRAGLPVKYHRVEKSRFMVIDIQDFWDWAEKHKSMIDLSRMPRYALGPEPEWTVKKRKMDIDKARRQGYQNGRWTPGQDAKLKWMLKQHRFTYADIAKEIRHSEGAVKRRITDLGLKERPVRNAPRKWSDEEIEIMCRMLDRGHDWSQIADRLGRTALAVRGKYERIMNPDYMKRYHMGKGAFDYQRINEMSAMEVLGRYKALQDAEFKDAPPLNE